MQEGQVPSVLSESVSSRIERGVSVNGRASLGEGKARDRERAMTALALSVCPTGRGVVEPLALCLRGMTQ